MDMYGDEFDELDALLIDTSAFGILPIDVDSKPR